MVRTQQIKDKYVARGEAGLAEWHRFLRTVTFVCALVLMSLSLVALHWALTLVGIPNIPAWIGGVFLEAGMAATASTATTIRKRRTDPTKPGGYYISLWIIFSFLMALAQAANIGHAVVSVANSMSEIPAFIPPTVVYGFAAAFAALFPLGGTMFVHVSGFLRAHSIDAEWIDEDAQVVRVVSDPAAQPAPRVARTKTAQPAREVTAQPAAQMREEKPAKAARTDPAREALFEEYRAGVARGERMDSNRIAEALEIHPGNARTLRGKWDKRIAAELAIADPVRDEILEQLPVEQQQVARSA